MSNVRLMSPRIVLTVTGSQNFAPLPRDVTLFGSTQNVWQQSGSWNIGTFESIEYRNFQVSHLVVVQRVNTGSYLGNVALLSIAWVPVIEGTNENVTFDMMSSQFIADGLIHKVWKTLDTLVADSTPVATSAKAAWPAEWIVSGSMFIGSVIA